MYHDFDNYFSETIAHPQNILESEILPFNTLYTYISSTFLNGYINYVKIIKGFVISRYTSWNEWYDDDKIYIQEPPASCNWINFYPKTKLEAYNKIIEKDRKIHTKLNCLNDNILILSNIGYNKYCYFWFDCDIFDCNIGRFETPDPEDKVIEIFSKFCKSRSLQLSKSYLNKEEEAKELPFHFFSGWLTF